jgi:hypothetical protein
MEGGGAFYLTGSVAKGPTDIGSLALNHRPILSALNVRAQWRQCGHEVSAGLRHLLRYPSVRVLA